MDNLAYIEEPNRDDHQMEHFEDFIIGLFVVVFDTKKGKYDFHFFSVVNCIVSHISYLILYTMNCVYF